MVYELLGLRITQVLSLSKTLNLFAAKSTHVDQK